MNSHVFKGYWYKIFSRVSLENAHRLAITLLRFGLSPKRNIFSIAPILGQNVFRISFFKSIDIWLYIFSQSPACSKA